MTLCWLLSELVDVSRQLGLQVCSLVLVDKVCLCQLVQHLLYFRIQRYSLSLVVSCTQLANSITHCLTVVSVVESSLLLLSDSLD